MRGFSGVRRDRKLRENRVHIVQSRVRDRALTSFVIGDDHCQPYERRTIVIVDEVEKLLVPIRDVPDVLLSLF